LAECGTFKYTVRTMMIGLPYHRDLFRRLHEERRLHRIEDETRRADRPAARLAAEGGLPASTLSFRAFT
jgi:hypothetical protein